MRCSTHIFVRREVWHSVHASLRGINTSVTGYLMENIAHVVESTMRPTYRGAQMSPEFL